MESINVVVYDSGYSHDNPNGDDNIFGDVQYDQCITTNHTHLLDEITKG